jgi:transcriptional regulator with XRE-family HTH domain
MLNLQAVADFLNREMDRQRINDREVAERSGNAITHQTVWNIKNRVSKDIKIGTLVGLAKGLNIKEEAMMAIAFGSKPEPLTLERFIAELQALGVEEINPAKGMKALTPADMEEILEVAKSNVRATVTTMVEQKIKGKKGK